MTFCPPAGNPHQPLLACQGPPPALAGVPAAARVGWDPRACLLPAMEHACCTCYTDYTPSSTCKPGGSQSCISIFGCPASSSVCENVND